DNNETGADLKQECAIKTNPATVSKFSLDMQKDACAKIMKDNCFPESSRLLIAFLQDNMLLHEKLRFLESCLVPTSRSLQVAKEKSWTNFIKLYTINAINIYPFIQPQGLAFIYCLNLFEIIVDNYYAEPTTIKQAEKSLDIKYKDKDILNYIGGCILFRIKSQVGRVNENDIKKHSKLSILNSLIETNLEGSESCSLTSVLNRGSLIHIRSELSTFFFEIESIFQTIFPKPVESSFSFDKFLKMCVDNLEI
uniref:Uncharacterized protein n=1 Tax=Biomphalaria glabrata TaxID=6526 RepID=A0A2C9M6B5_BIOGL